MLSSTNRTETIHGPFILLARAPSRPPRTMASRQGTGYLRSLSLSAGHAAHRRRTGVLPARLITEPIGADKWAAQRVGAAAVLASSANAACGPSSGSVTVTPPASGVADSEICAGMFETSSGWGNHLIGF